MKTSLWYAITTLPAHYPCYLASSCCTGHCQYSAILCGQNISHNTGVHIRPENRESFVASGLVEMLLFAHGQMCMLLNNLQAFRANIHSLFEEMGGSEVSWISMHHSS